MNIYDARKLQKKLCNPNLEHIQSTMMIGDKLCYAVLHRVSDTPAVSLTVNTINAMLLRSTHGVEIDVIYSDGSVCIKGGPTMSTGMWMCDLIKVD